jgi:opacity protein-like surface antigen
MSYPKHVVLLLLFMLSVIIPIEAMAYNEDSRIHFEALFEALERDIEEEATTFQGQNFPEETATAQSLRLLGKLSIRVIDPLEIYGLIGGSDLEVDDFGFSSDFEGAYGGGARVILFRERDPRRPFQIFADYHFLRFEAEDRVSFAPTIDLNGNGVIDPGETLTDEIVEEEIDWLEHVLKIGVMGRHYEFEPYGGIRFSVVRGEDRIHSQVQRLDLDIENDDTFGIFLGTAYYLSPSEQAALFVEGSLFDQYSLTGGIRVGF